jgi:hypothetical protein
MRGIFAVLAITAICAAMVAAQPGPADGPYKVLKTAKVGGDGAFDYISADVAARRLYIPRRDPSGLTVFNLDTLEPVGAIPTIAAGGAVVDPKTHHGFSTTKPITMWDAETLKVIKTIDVDGRPDGMLFDRFNERVWILSHQPPYATVIDAVAGTVVGTIDLGGAPEEATTDGNGTVYVNISDKANVAVVDAKTLTVTAHYDVSSKGVSGGSGLSLDQKNGILFAYYRQPSPTVVILSAKDGKIITTMPTGAMVDTVAFNPQTMEAISAEGAGSMTFIKENSPTEFVLEQTVKTMAGAKTLVLDTKTGHLLTMTAEYGPAPAGGQQPGPGGPPPTGAGGPPPQGAGGPPMGGRPMRGPMLPGSFSILMIGR